MLLLQFIMTRNHLISLLKQNGIIKVDNTLNPVFNKRLLNNPELAQHLVNLTTFLQGDPTFKIRLHVLLSGITEQPTCIQCGKDVVMRIDGKYQGTFPKYCSNTY